MGAQEWGEEEEPGGWHPGGGGGGAPSAAGQPESTCVHNTGAQGCLVSGRARRTESSKLRDPDPGWLPLESRGPCCDPNSIKEEPLPAPAMVGKAARG